MDALTAQDPARIGPFRLVARLGRGGMGRVYLGRDESSGRHAAVKTIHGELAADPEFRTRFTQEVNAALRVRDEYIAEVVLADPAAAVPWLATAYVPGISVEDAVRKYGPMPAESVRVLGACVARAGAAIHTGGRVHRDLKPGHVLLTAQGPKVIDFGIARGVGDEGLTKTGMVAGSPPYMAPEQLVSGEFGPASDVFSLGSILHYAATAAGPYGRGGAQELYARALAVGPVVAPDLPAALVGPVTRALARSAAERPSAAELGALLETEPGEKPAPGWLPSNVTQEILTQATEALTTASAAYNDLSASGQQQNNGQQAFGQQGLGQQSLGQQGQQGRPAFAPPFPQPAAPSNPSSHPSHPSHPSNPQNPVYGTPAHPSNPQNPVFAPPNSGPSRTFGPPQQVFQQQPQPQQYPQTPPRQTQMPQQQLPYPQQAAAGFGQQRPGTPPQGTGYRYPQAPMMAPSRSNGMGTAGLTLSIIGLILPCLLVLGIIFSGIGLSRSSSQGMPAGTSKAGLTISLLGIVGWVLLVVISVTHGSSSGSS